MKRLTAIVPCFNEQEVLPLFYDEIVRVADLMRNEVEFEVIFINDGSTDNSLDILEKFAKSDERIRIISQENKGLGATKNVGLRHVNGEYVFFVDSDDYIALDALEKLYENSQSNTT